MKRRFLRAGIRGALACLVSAGLFFTGCAAPPEEEMPRTAPVEGFEPPAVIALAWLDAVSIPGASPDGGYFAVFTVDGASKVWDAFSGRMIEAAGAGETGRFPLSGIQPETVFPVSSPDGTKKLMPSGDGAVCLLDAAGKELARYYGFSAGAWISTVPGGFYNASLNGSGAGGGASFLEARTSAQRYTFQRLSGALFRPDLFRAGLTGEGAGDPRTLKSLFEEDQAPPLVSVSVPADGEKGSGRLEITVTARDGGIGQVALYRRSGAFEIPAGLFPAEEAAFKKDLPDGGTCYSISVNAGPGEIGVSAFNGTGTVESEPVWCAVPEPDSFQEPVPPPRPVLRALLAAGDGGQEDARALGEFISREEGGGLYPEVKLESLSGAAFTREAFLRSLAGLCKNAAEDDALVLYIRGGFSASPAGDPLIVTDGGEEISGGSILTEVLGARPHTLIILDLESGVPGITAETALLRFRQKLGPRAMLAVSGAGGQNALIGGILENLAPDYTAPETFAGSGPDRYISAADFIAAYANGAPGTDAPAKQESFHAFFPAVDFRLASRFAGGGELKFQTMASGMLKIDQVDKSPVPLPFGQTMTRPLPPGDYIIDMIYRNGYRETRTVELRAKDSRWVIFTYTPPLLTGDFSRQLPALGINTAELNPVNYAKVNREAMEGMGMAPYYVAFLAGEKFYKEGSFDKAIGEYSRAISLKAGYADAYVSRGNAWRKQGNFERALDDYSRAISLKGGDAGVFNYRGFVYARQGDQEKAIADYTQAIRYSAGYADAYFNRAYAYSGQGDWDRAIADYTQVIKLEPSNAVAYNERGKAYLGKGEEEKAAADFTAAENLTP